MANKKIILRTDVDGAQEPMLSEHRVVDPCPDIELIGANCATDAEVIAAARDVDVIITNESYINRTVLEALPRLKGVVRYGIGYDRVDIHAAAELGKTVVNVPDFCFEEIGNHVLMFILAWTKKVVKFTGMVRAGKWVEARAMKAPMGTIYGQRLGVVGFGNLGKITARKARLLDMEVVTCSAHLSDAEAAALGVKKVSEAELYRTSDFVSVNAALNDRTRHSIGRAQFEMMKPSAVLINTARGPIVDEDALVEALKTGRIAGACLDVCEEEPCIGRPILELDNVLFTPHCGAYSDAAFARLDTCVAEEAVRLCRGEAPLHPVTPANVR